MRSQISTSDSSRLALNEAHSVIPFKNQRLAAKANPAEETLIVDERAFRRPAQAVEDKLSRILETSCIGVSQLRLKTLLSSRAKTADQGGLGN